MVLRWFLVSNTIGSNGFPMDFGPKTITSNGFPMFFWSPKPLVAMVFQWFPLVANHWSDDGMVTIHCSGLIAFILKALKANILLENYIWLY